MRVGCISICVIRGKEKNKFLLIIFSVFSIVVDILYV